MSSTVVEDPPPAEPPPESGWRPQDRWQRLFCAEPEVSAAGLLGRIEDLERLITQLHGLQGRDLQQLRRLSAAAQGVPESALHDEAGWVTSEVGWALGLSEGQVQSTLAFADGLDRHPHVAALVEQGEVPMLTARRCVDHLGTLGALLSPERLAKIEAQTVAWLRQRPRTVGALNRRMRKLILQAQADTDPDGSKTIARNHARRRVEISSDGDGTAQLWARLPEADALAIAKTLDALSAQRDGRSRDQRRADLLVALVTAQPAVYGQPDDVPTSRKGAPVQVTLNVTVPIHTLTGASNAPGDLPGYGPVPAVTVRDLTAQPGTRYRALLYDADSGQLRGVARGGKLNDIAWIAGRSPAKGYQHPPVMDDLIRQRDQHCRAPHCGHTATHADLDHIVPWPAGPTTIDNSATLCRYHHRLKTHARHWRLNSTNSGDLTWHTPAGRTHTTETHDYRDEPPPF